MEKAQCPTDFAENPGILDQWERLALLRLDQVSDTLSLDAVHDQERGRGFCCQFAETAEEEMLHSDESFRTPVE